MKLKTWDSSVKIRAAHEVVAAGAAELALLVVQLVAASRAPAPVFPGTVVRGGRGGFTGLGGGWLRSWVLGRVGGLHAVGVRRRD